VKIIIIGAGEVGFNIASRLSLENKDVIVIDKDASALSRISNTIDVQVLQGHGSNPAILKEAGIQDADIFLAVTNSDEINIVASLITDILSPSTIKIARIRETEYNKLQNALKEHPPHIDTIINPDVEVVKTISRLIKIPGAIDVGEFAEGRLKLIGIRIDDKTPFSGISLKNIFSSINKRVLIAAIIRDEQLIIPSGNDKLLHGDLVYIVSEDNGLSETLAVFGKHFEPFNRAMIVGGGRIGFKLATLFEEQSIQTKLIEKNQARCNFLSEHLDKTLILHGNGSDQTLLLEENIGNIDVMITLTGDEETNILTSLLAKNLGAKKTITRINKMGYFPIMNSIGIEHVVSPRLSAINTILQHVRKGKVLSSQAIKGEFAEVLEAVALETSDIVGKPLKKLSFPKGVLIIGIMRKEDIIIPTGDSVIEPNDRIIIFSTKEAIPKVEKTLTVKLEFF